MPCVAIMVNGEKSRQRSPHVDSFHVLEILSCTGDLVAGGLLVFEPGHLGGTRINSGTSALIGRHMGEVLSCSGVHRENVVICKPERRPVPAPGLASDPGFPMHPLRL